MSNVSVHIVARNTMSSLPGILSAISNQTYKDITLRIADNASSDNVASFVAVEAPGSRVIRNARDIGVVNAQNQLIRMAMQSWRNEDLSEQFVLLLDNDITPDSDTVAELVGRLQKSNDLGAVGGKILRMFDENIQDEALHELVQSDHIDSVGLIVSPSLAFVSRGAGEVDTGQYDDLVTVFAIPESMMLVRASALVDVRHSEEEYLDAELSSEYSVVDLACRLQRRGWDIEYVPSARAYRYSGVFQGHRKHKNKLTERCRNHLLIVIKNLSFFEFVKNLHRILPVALISLPSFFRNPGIIFKMLKKRKRILIAD